LSKITSETALAAGGKLYFSLLRLPEALKRSLFFLFNRIDAMARETVILECTEARKENKPVSRYMTSRNKTTQPERVEKKKYNPHLRRHTLHREIK